MDPLATHATTIELSEAQSAVPNGAWTWFSGERAIVDTDAGPGGPRVLVGTVAAGDDSRGGDIDVLWYDLGRGEAGHFTLHEGLEQDDHNGPALFVRPDGRYLAMYAKHGSDSYTRWRVSTDPHDPTRWEPERTFDNEAETTYCNVYQDEVDDVTYCFTRSRNWDPNVLVSADNGSTWSDGGKLLSYDDDEQRPYARYQAGKGRIHVTTTEGHPHVSDNGIYHGYVAGGVLYDSTGDSLAELAADGAPAVTDLTPVFPPRTTVDGKRMTRAWTVDVGLDDQGHPVTIFQARVDDDPTDHRFFYAAFDGHEWTVHPVAAAGPGLYETELDYTGLASIDPDDAGRMVVSTPIDPRDDSALDHHELFAGVTPDGGESWEWTPLTPDASTDNLRPLIPAWDGDNTALLWMRGRYHTYRQWETDIVGLIDRQ